MGQAEALSFTAASAIARDLPRLAGRQWLGIVLLFAGVAAFGLEQVVQEAM